MQIDPIEWLEVANRRAPKIGGVTDWIDGTQAPVRVGYYERHFTDSPTIGLVSMQYWDGEFWRTSTYGTAHWRQVGDYPCWRGLTKAQARIQGARMSGKRQA